jgi:hypothetical protein
VSYAKQDAQAEDEVAGSGLGVVDVFDMAGTLVRRLIPAGGKLDAPWGDGHGAGRLRAVRQRLAGRQFRRRRDQRLRSRVRQHSSAR